MFNLILYTQQNYKIQFLLNKKEDQYDLQIINKDNTIMDKVTPIYESNTQLFRNLVSHFYKENANEWSELHLQNTKWKYLCNNKLNNQWIIRSKGLSPKQYSLQFKLRMNLMNWQYLQFLYKISNKNTCMMCQKNEVQTNKHILQGCDKLVNLYRKRHNKITSRLAKVLKYNNNYVLYEDCRLSKFENISKSNEKLRPDIILVNKYAKEMVIIEVGVAYADNYESLENSYKNKLDKYQSLISELKAREWKVDYKIIIVDSTGIIENEVYKTIKNIILKYTNIKLKSIESIIKNIQLDTIYSAYEIFNKVLIAK